MAFITNELNIKSSKSSNYPIYSSTITIEGCEYEAKKVIANNDFIKNKKVLWNKEHTQAFGDIETIKAIARSKGMNESEVKEVNINEIEIMQGINLNLDVFFSEEMYRLVAKIAFEWYCAQNKVQHKYEGFHEIINYIVEGIGENIVSIVDDIDINDKFNEYCNYGSHCLLGYETKDGEVNVFVDMFGLIVYNVKVCEHIPSFCKNNCLLQKLNLDSTRNSICLNNYNDLKADINNSILGRDESFPIQIVNGVKICVAKPSKDLTGHIFYLSLLSNLDKRFCKKPSYTEEIIDILKKNIINLLQGSVLHKMSLKRFVIERIDFNSPVILNKNSSDKESIFNYYILFMLGNKNIKEVNNDVLMKIVLDNFGKYEINVDEEVSEKMKYTILKDENYSSIIMDGAKKILEW